MWVKNSLGFKGKELDQGLFLIGRNHFREGNFVKKGKGKGGLKVGSGRGLAT